MPWPWTSVSKNLWIRSFKLPSRYFSLMQVKRLQKYQRSKLEVEKDPTESADLRHVSVELDQVGNFIFTSKFELWYFCSLSTYKDVKYLIWKILFTSVWRQNFKAMAWLLLCITYDGSNRYIYPWTSSRGSWFTPALWASNLKSVTNFQLILGAIFYQVSIFFAIFEPKNIESKMMPKIACLYSVSKPSLV